MCCACLFFAGQSWATTCITSAKITQGQGGAAVSAITVSTYTGTLTNYFLEISIDSYVGNPIADPLAGDFCSITYARSARLHWGTLLNANPSWNVEYGTPVANAFAGCSNRVYVSTQPLSSPFTDQFRFFDGAIHHPFEQTQASVFWVSTGTNTQACSGSKLYIPITINYNLGTNNTMVIDSLQLFKNVALCCGTTTNTTGTSSATGSTIQIRQVVGSCALTAPTLSLGTYSTNSIHSQGILGGVLKSSNITLTCNNMPNGVNVTPFINISDAGAPSNTSCNPVNIASTPAPAQIALFNSNKIVFDSASRYCVAPSTNAPNTIAFPKITSSTYTQSIPIYAGIYSATQPVKKAGALLSVLQLTVYYR